MLKIVFCRQGRPSHPETMMHFPPMFQISHPIFEKFSDSGKFSQFYLFPKNFLIFICRNFLLLFFPLLLQISPLFYTNSPAFYILCVYFPPTLTMMHLCITQCTYWTPLGVGFIIEINAWL